MPRERPGLDALGELAGALRFREAVTNHLLNTVEGAAYQRGAFLIFQPDLDR